MAYITIMYEWWTFRLNMFDIVCMLHLIWCANKYEFETELFTFIKFVVFCKHTVYQTLNPISIYHHE